MILAFIRFILFGLYMVFLFGITLILSIIRPFHKNNTYVVARMMSKMHHILGIKIVIRGEENLPKDGKGIYICNHHSNLDSFVLTAAIQKNTITIGKHSVLYIPVFGIMFVLLGNLLIKRENKEKAIGKMKQAAQKVTEKGVNIWVFPEGHRSLGRGLLPFKMGAFHLAQDTHLPVIPICTSDYYQHFSFKQWDNGTVYIDFLKPITVPESNKETLKLTVKNIHDEMEDYILKNIPNTVALEQKVKNKTAK